MAVRQRRYSKHDLAQRGRELYSMQIQSQVESGNEGKIVAIDVDSSAFEVDEDTLVASDRLLARYPDAQTWFVRIGARGVHSFGWHQKVEVK